MLCVNTSHHRHSRTLNVKNPPKKPAWPAALKSCFHNRTSEADVSQFRLLNIQKVWSKVTCKEALESILLYTSQGGKVSSQIYSTYRQYNICSVSSVQQPQKTVGASHFGHICTMPFCSIKDASSVFTLNSPNKEKYTKYLDDELN